MLKQPMMNSFHGSISKYLCYLVVRTFKDRDLLLNMVKCYMLTTPKMPILVDIIGNHILSLEHFHKL